MKTLKTVRLFFLSFLMITIFGCSDSQSNKISAKAPTISVKLVDSPGDYDEVNVNVVGVMIKMDDSDDDSGWIDLEMIKTGTIDLLNLTGGVNEVLVDRFPIPVGTLKQIRLVLGDGNTIVIRNNADEPETFDLKTPSAQQSGLKVKVDAVIEEGFTYNYILDFDVEKSIVIAGNSDNIILKPVLYASAEVSSGIIEGTITPTDVPSMVSVLVDDMGNDDPEDDFIISANTEETGAFALWGVPEGTYDVIVTPIDITSDYEETIVSGVLVTNGEVTILSDPIELMLKPATVSGTISGLADGVIATISINDSNSTNVETNASGEYIIEDILPGDYTVTIGATGYVSQEFMVTLEPSEIEIIDATLVLE